MNFQKKKQTGASRMFGIQKLLVLATVAAVGTTSAVVGIVLIGGSQTGQDYGVDTNGNGLYDFLVVRMPYEVKSPDRHVAVALLTGEGSNVMCYGDMMPIGYGITGYPISATVSYLFLEEEDNAIKLAFKGKEIYHSGINGPYHVQAWVLPESEVMELLGNMMGIGGPMGGQYPGGPMTIPLPWTYTTGAYEYTDFEVASMAIRFTGSNADQGLDTNGNGLFEYLEVTAGVQVNLAGNYQISANLMANFRPDISPYPGLELTMPMVYAFDIVDLEEGLQTLTFGLPGDEIRRAGIDGPYNVSLSAYYVGDYSYGNWTMPREAYPDPIGMQVPGYFNPGQMQRPQFDYYYDYACHRTQAYDSEQFEEEVKDLEFTGQFSDKGVDRNGNGLYDELIVEAGVNVYSAGFYSVMAMMFTSDENQMIATGYSSAYMEKGAQTLATSFLGYEIRSSGQNGSYHVHITAMKMNRFEPVEAYYDTSTYTYDQFEEYPEWEGERGYWIESMEATASGEPPNLEGTASVTVRRGPDLLTYVLQDTVYLDVEDSNGNVVFSSSIEFSIPSGGGSANVSFSFSLPEHGSYTAKAYLGSRQYPVDFEEFRFQA